MQTVNASGAPYSRIPRAIRPRRRIGVDVDEVLTPFCRPMFERAGHECPEGKFPYHYAAALGISQTDSTRMVYDFYESQEFADLKPIPGALAGLSFFMNALDYDVYIITGRQDRVRQKTEEWVERYFPGVVRDVILTNSFTSNSISKANLCKSLAISAMVDDSHQVCMECEYAHVKGINYVGDPIYPWCEENALAAHNWDEVTGVVSRLQ